MKIICILFLLTSFYFHKIFGRIFVKEVGNNDPNEVTKYISGLIRDGNEKRPTEIHDVAVLKFLSQNRSDLYDAILKNIPHSNAVITPKNGRIIKIQKLRAASYIIIVSDFIGYVSFCDP